MPTLKPRVQVTLEPQTHEIIDRFARLQKRTRGSIISELLDSIAPPLARTVALLEAAQEAPKSVKQGLRSVVEGLHGDLVAATGQASVALEQLQLVIEDGSGTGSTPVSVTRGSGTDSTPSSTRKKSSTKGSKPGVSKG